jgi:hypothetical protein
MDRSEADILGLLAAHESAVGRLYEVFASVHLERQDLWRTLARDENEHAHVLARLRSLSEVDQCGEGAVAARPAAVRSSIAYVESQAARAQKGGINAVQALAIAADLENALIEKQFLRPGGSTCPEMTAALAGLERDTERHRQTLMTALEAERESGRRP